MVSEIHDYWLSFSLTPIQKWVEAARTVRDLGTGSRLFALLVYQAFEAAKAAGGTALFPTTPTPETMPNQFTITYASEEQARKGAEEARRAVQAKWEEVAGKVWEFLNAKWAGISPDWHADWDEQVTSFWEPHAIVLDTTQVTDSLLTRLFPNRKFPAGEPGDLAKPWAVMGAALTARKQVRHWPGNQGQGRQKCSILGELEQMGPTGGLKALDDFWKQKQVRTAQMDHILIGPRDRLCAVSLVKRFAAAFEDLPPWSDKSGTVPDTAQVATAAWVNEANQCCEVQSKLKAFENAVVTLNTTKIDAGKLLPHTESPWRLLLEENISVQSYLDEYSEETLDRDRQAKLKDLLHQIRHKKTELRDAASKAGLPTPPKYLAVLAMDGDHMGKRLSGELCNSGEFNSDFHAAISQQLQDYAKLAKDVVKEHQGTHIYSGGDDILALVPKGTVLDCVQKLHKEFPCLMGSKERATISAGIAIFHYKHDLRDALHHAHGALKAAKDDDRDRTGMSVLKRSGGDIHVTALYEDVERIQRLGKLYRAGASFRWLSQVQQLAPALERAEQNQLKMQLDYFIRSAESSAGADKQKQVEAKVLQLLEQCFSIYGKPEPPAPFERFMKFIGVAAFLARGRE